MTYNVGDHIEVWWETGTRKDGKNVARVLEVRPYRGPFDGSGQGPYGHLHCLCILRLPSPPSANNKKGWIEMSVLKGNEPSLIDMTTA